MNINVSDVQGYSDLAQPFTGPIIEALIKPHIERLNKWMTSRGKKNKVEDHFWENKFEKYLEDVFVHAQFVTTLVFPNSRTRLKDLYIPLTIRTDHNSYEFGETDVFDYSIFDKYKKIVVSDYAGMGKSTLLKWITLSIIEQKKGIPILIELRKIDEKNDLLGEIFNQLNPINDTVDKDLVYELLDIGHFTILLDGFDEIPNNLQDRITTQLSDFIRKTRKNNFVLTSRPESALVSFFDFQLFHIRKLREKDAYALIEKLDAISHANIGTRLIADIEERNQQVKEFLENPFLVSLLYKAYSYNLDIPTKKVTFYEEVYSSLFKYHDLSKEGFKRAKRSGLDIFDFEIVLRDVAFETSKLGKVMYDRDELMRFISETKTRNPKIQFKEQDFYDDLTTTVPLFISEGSRIKWAHKSIQDFFAAKYISNHSKKQLIVEVLFKSKRYSYLNILDLLGELEYRVFRNAVVKPLLLDFLVFRNTQFPVKPQVAESQIELRIAFMYGVIIEIRRDSIEDFQRNDPTEEPLYDDESTDTLRFMESEVFTSSLAKSSFEREVAKMLRRRGEDVFLDGLVILGDESGKSKFKLGKTYRLDDSVRKPYNLPETFLMVNSILWNLLGSELAVTGATFSYEKCIKRLEEIEREIADEESQDLFSNIL